VIFWSTAEFEDWGNRAHPGSAVISARATNASMVFVLGDVWYTLLSINFDERMIYSNK
jgi:hypothetical protein